MPKFPQPSRLLQNTALRRFRTRVPALTKKGKPLGGGGGNTFHSSPSPCSSAPGVLTGKTISQHKSKERPCPDDAAGCGLLSSLVALQQPAGHLREQGSGGAEVFLRLLEKLNGVPFFFSSSHVHAVHRESSRAQQIVFALQRVEKTGGCHSRRAREETADTPPTTSLPVNQSSSSSSSSPSSFFPPPASSSASSSPYRLDNGRGGGGARPGILSAVSPYPPLPQQSLLSPSVSQGVFLPQLSFSRNGRRPQNTRTPPSPPETPALSPGVIANTSACLGLPACSFPGSSPESLQRSPGKLSLCPDHFSFFFFSSSSSSSSPVLPFSAVVGRSLWQGLQQLRKHVQLGSLSSPPKSSTSCPPQGRANQASKKRKARVSPVALRETSDGVTGEGVVASSFLFPESEQYKVSAGRREDEGRRGTSVSDEVGKEEEAFHETAENEVSCLLKTGELEKERQSEVSLITREEGSSEANPTRKDVGSRLPPGHGGSLVYERGKKETEKPSEDIPSQKEDGDVSVGGSAFQTGNDTFEGEGDANREDAECMSKRQRRRERRRRAAQAVAESMREEKALQGEDVGAYDCFIDGVVADQEETRAKGFPTSSGQQTRRALSANFSIVRVEQILEGEEEEEEERESSADELMRGMAQRNKKDETKGRAMVGEARAGDKVQAEKDGRTGAHEEVVSFLEDNKEARTTGHQEPSRPSTYRVPPPSSSPEKRVLLKDVSASTPRKGQEHPEGEQHSSPREATGRERKEEGGREEDVTKQEQEGGKDGEEAKGSRHVVRQSPAVSWDGFRQCPVGAKRRQSQTEVHGEELRGGEDEEEAAGDVQTGSGRARGERASSTQGGNGVPNQRPHGKEQILHGRRVSRRSMKIVDISLKQKLTEDEVYAAVSPLQFLLRRGMSLLELTLYWESREREKRLTGGRKKREEEGDDFRVRGSRRRSTAPRSCGEGQEATFGRSGSSSEERENFGEQVKEEEQEGGVFPPPSQWEAGGKSLEDVRQEDDRAVVKDEASFEFSPRGLESEQADRVAILRKIPAAPKKKQGAPLQPNSRHDEALLRVSSSSPLSRVSAAVLPLVKETRQHLLRLGLPKFFDLHLPLVASVLLCLRYHSRDRSRGGHARPTRDKSKTSQEVKAEKCLSTEQDRGGEQGAVRKKTETDLESCEGTNGRIDDATRVGQILQHLLEVSADALKETPADRVLLAQKLVECQRAREEDEAVEKEVVEDKAEKTEVEGMGLEKTSEAFSAEADEEEEEERRISPSTRGIHTPLSTGAMFEAEVLRPSLLSSAAVALSSARRLALRLHVALELATALTERLDVFNKEEGRGCSAMKNSGGKREGEREDRSGEAGVGNDGGRAERVSDGRLEEKKPSEHFKLRREGVCTSSRPDEEKVDVERKRQYEAEEGGRKDDRPLQKEKSRDFFSVDGCSYSSVPVDPPPFPALSLEARLPCENADVGSCCVEVVAVEKLNGENAQISFSSTLRKWCVCSKNVCLLLVSSLNGRASKRGKRRGNSRLVGLSRRSRSLSAPIDTSSCHGGEAEQKRSGPSWGYDPEEVSTLASTEEEVKNVEEAKPRMRQGEGRSSEEAKRKASGGRRKEGRGGHEEEGRDEDRVPEEAHGGMKNTSAEEEEEDGGRGGESEETVDDLRAKKKELRYQHALKVARAWRRLLKNLSEMQVLELQTFLTKHTLVGELVGCSEKQHFVRYDESCKEIYEARPSLRGSRGGRKGETALGSSCSAPSGPAQGLPVKGQASFLIFYAVVPHDGLRLCLPPLTALHLLKHRLRLPTARVCGSIRARGTYELLAKLQHLVDSVFCQDVVLVDGEECLDGLVVGSGGEGVVLYFSGPCLRPRLPCDSPASCSNVSPSARAVPHFQSKKYLSEVSRRTGPPEEPRKEATATSKKKEEKAQAERMKGERNESVDEQGLQPRVVTPDLCALSEASPHSPSLSPAVSGLSSSTFLAPPFFSTSPCPSFGSSCALSASSRSTGPSCVVFPLVLGLAKVKCFGYTLRRRIREKLRHSFTSCKILELAPHLRDILEDYPADRGDATSVFSSSAQQSKRRRRREKAKDTEGLAMWAFLEGELKCMRTAVEEKERREGAGTGWSQVASDYCTASEMWGREQDRYGAHPALSSDQIPESTDCLDSEVLSERRAALHRAQRRVREIFEMTCAEGGARARRQDSNASGGVFSWCGPARSSQRIEAALAVVETVGSRWSCPSFSFSSSSACAALSSANSSRCRLLGASLPPLPASERPRQVCPSFSCPAASAHPGGCRLNPAVVDFLQEAMGLIPPQPQYSKALDCIRSCLRHQSSSHVGCYRRARLPLHEKSWQDRLNNNAEDVGDTALRRADAPSDCPPAAEKRGSLKRGKGSGLLAIEKTSYRGQGVTSGSAIRRGRKHIWPGRDMANSVSVTCSDPGGRVPSTQSKPPQEGGSGGGMAGSSSARSGPDQHREVIFDLVIRLTGSYHDALAYAAALATAGVLLLHSSDSSTELSPRAAAALAPARESREETTAGERGGGWGDGGALQSTLVELGSFVDLRFLDFMEEAAAFSAVLRSEGHPSPVTPPSTFPCKETQTAVSREAQRADTKDPGEETPDAFRELKSRQGSKAMTEEGSKERHDKRQSTDECRSFHSPARQQERQDLWLAAAERSGEDKREKKADKRQRDEEKTRENNGPVCILHDPGILNKGGHWNQVTSVPSDSSCGWSSANDSPSSASTRSLCAGADFGQRPRPLCQCSSADETAGPADTEESGSRKDVGESLGHTEGSRPVLCLVVPPLTLSVEIHDLLKSACSERGVRFILRHSLSPSCSECSHLPRSRPQRFDSRHRRRAGSLAGTAEGAERRESLTHSREDVKEKDGSVGGEDGNQEEPEKKEDQVVSSNKHRILSGPEGGERVSRKPPFPLAQISSPGGKETEGRGHHDISQREKRRSKVSRVTREEDESGVRGVDSSVDARVGSASLSHGREARLQQRDTSSRPGRCCGKGGASEKPLDERRKRGNHLEFPSASAPFRGCPSVPGSVADDGDGTLSSSPPADLIVVWGYTQQPEPPATVLGAWGECATSLCNLKLFLQKILPRDRECTGRLVKKARQEENEGMQKEATAVGASCLATCRKERSPGDSTDPTCEEMLRNRGGTSLRGGDSRAVRTPHSVERVLNSESTTVTHDGEEDLETREQTDDRHRRALASRQEETPTAMGRKTSPSLASGGRRRSLSVREDSRLLGETENERISDAEGSGGAAHLASRVDRSCTRATALFLETFSYRSEGAAEEAGGEAQDFAGGVVREGDDQHGKEEGDQGAAGHNAKKRGFAVSSFSEGAELFSSLLKTSPHSPSATGERDHRSSAALPSPVESFDERCSMEEKKKKKNEDSSSTCPREGKKKKRRLGSEEESSEGGLKNRGRDDGPRCGSLPEKLKKLVISDATLQFFDLIFWSSLGDKDRSFYSALMFTRFWQRLMCHAAERSRGSFALQSFSSKTTFFYHPPPASTCKPFPAGRHSRTQERDESTGSEWTGWAKAPAVEQGQRMRRKMPMSSPGESRERELGTCSRRMSSTSLKMPLSRRAPELLFIHTPLPQAPPMSSLEEAKPRRMGCERGGQDDEDDALSSRDCSGESERRRGLELLTQLAGADEGLRQFSRALDFLASVRTPPAGKTVERPERTDQKSSDGVSERHVASTAGVQAPPSDAGQSSPVEGGKASKTRGQAQSDSGPPASRGRIDTQAKQDQKSAGPAGTRQELRGAGQGKEGGDDDSKPDCQEENALRNPDPHRDTTEEEDVLALITCILPVGFPGCGKSTTLMHFVQRAVRNCLERRTERAKRLRGQHVGDAADGELGQSGWRKRGLSSGAEEDAEGGELAITVWDASSSSSPTPACERSPHVASTEKLQEDVLRSGMSGGLCSKQAPSISSQTGSGPAKETRDTEAGPPQNAGRRQARESLRPTSALPRESATKSLSRLGDADIVFLVSSDEATSAALRRRGFRRNGPANTCFRRVARALEGREGQNLSGAVRLDVGGMSLTETTMERGTEEEDEGIPQNEFRHAAREGASELNTSIDRFFSQLTERLSRALLSQMPAVDLNEPVQAALHTEEADTGVHPDSLRETELRDLSKTNKTSTGEAGILPLAPGGDEKEQSSRCSGVDDDSPKSGRPCRMQKKNRRPLRVCVLIDKNFPVEAVSKQACMLQRHVASLNRALSRVACGSLSKTDGSHGFDTGIPRGTADRVEERLFVKSAVCLMTLPPDARLDGSLRNRYLWSPFLGSSDSTVLPSMAFPNQWPFPWSLATLCQCLRRVLNRQDHPTLQAKKALRKSPDHNAGPSLSGALQGEPASATPMAAPAAACTALSTPAGSGPQGSSSHPRCGPEKWPLCFKSVQPVQQRGECNLVNVFLSFVGLFRGQSLEKADLLQNVTGVDEVFEAHSVWLPCEPVVTRPDAEQSESTGGSGLVASEETRGAPSEEATKVLRRSDSGRAVGVSEDRLSFEVERECASLIAAALRRMRPFDDNIGNALLYERLLALLSSCPVSPLVSQSKCRVASELQTASEVAGQLEATFQRLWLDLDYGGTFLQFQIQSVGAPPEAQFRSGSGRDRGGQGRPLEFFARQRRQPSEAERGHVNRTAGRDNGRGNANYTQQGCQQDRSGHRGLCRPVDCRRLPGCGTEAQKGIGRSRVGGPVDLSGQRAGAVLQETRGADSENLPSRLEETQLCPRDAPQGLGAVLQPEVSSRRGVPGLQTECRLEPSRPSGQQIQGGNPSSAELSKTLESWVGGCGVDSTVVQVMLPIYYSVDVQPQAPTLFALVRSGLDDILCHARSDLLRSAAASLSQVVPGLRRINELHVTSYFLGGGTVATTRAEIAEIEASLQEKVLEAQKCDAPASSCQAVFLEYSSPRQVSGGGAASAHPAAEGWQRRDHAVRTRECLSAFLASRLVIGAAFSFAVTHLVIFGEGLVVAAVRPLCPLLLLPNESDSCGSCPRTRSEPWPGNFSPAGRMSSPPPSAVPPEMAQSRSFPSAGGASIRDGSLTRAPFGPSNEKWQETSTQSRGRHLGGCLTGNVSTPREGGELLDTCPPSSSSTARQMPTTPEGGNCKTALPFGESRYPHISLMLARHLKPQFSNVVAAATANAMTQAVQRQLLSPTTPNLFQTGAARVRKESCGSAPVQDDELLFSSVEEEHDERGGGHWIAFENLLVAGRRATTLVWCAPAGTQVAGNFIER